MKKTLTIFFSLLISWSFAQKSATEYHEMLEGMYENTVPFMQTEELKKVIDQDNVYILDTRTPAEYNVSHISGAQLVNYDTFDIRKLAHIPKDAKVVLYCSVGWRSERIGEKLQKNGYQNVYNLYGGMFEWYNEGRPVVNTEGKTVDIHTYNSDWGQWVKKR